MHRCYLVTVQDLHIFTEEAPCDAYLRIFFGCEDGRKMNLRIFSVVRTAAKKIFAFFLVVRTAAK